MSYAKDEQLSENFGLHEMLRSQTARRKGGDILDSQMNPDRSIIRNLSYLVTTSLQPLRTLLKTVITVSSGYRCKALNELIGGAESSQHTKGMAADLVLSGEFMYRASRERLKSIVAHKILEVTGLPVRENVNSNFYLFATACLFAEELDIDQLIHEYGEPGTPDWVHLSAGINTKQRRQFLYINHQGAQALDLREALMLGCK